MLNFRRHLKAEVFEYLDNILLKLLNHNYTPFSTRIAGLKVLGTLVKDSQILIDLFLNYDLTTLLDNSNLVEKMLDLLGKVSQGRYSK